MVFWVFQAIKYFKLSNNQNFITRMESDFLYPIFSTISSHSSAKSKSSKQHKCSIEKSCHFIFVAKSTENRKINMAKKAATPNEGPEKLITTNTEKKMWFPRFVYVCVCMCVSSMHVCFWASSSCCVAGVAENWWTNICLYL